MREDRARPIFQIIAILVGYSITLSILKFWMGHVVSSEAIRSDGWNNFADTLYSILLGIGFYIALQPADASHPHGHRRFESMIGLMVGLVILGTGVHILRECWKYYADPHPPTPNRWVIGVTVVLMLSKIWIASMCRRAGVRLGRPALVAVGRDQQMDIFATLSSLIGYGGGIWWAAKLDPVCGGLISLWVFKIGGETIYEHVDQLTGRSAPPEILSAIQKAVDESSVFFGMNDLRTHSIGPEYHVSLNVFADKNLTLEAVHDAEEDLKARLCRIPGVASAFIHIEPAEKPAKK